MKWILLISIVFNSYLYSQGIYFSEPTSSQPDYIWSNGQGPIAYNFYHAASIFVYHYYAKLTYPDGSQSNWMEGETGGWWVSKAGTYQIQGKAWVENVSGGGAYWATREAFSFSVIDNYAPSAPQNLGVNPNPGNNRIRLTWAANTELDLSSYEVWRMVDNWQWFNIATTSNTYFIDPDYYYNDMGPSRIDYKIKAKDINNNYSTYSDVVFWYGYPSKRMTNNDYNNGTAKFEYDLSNHPNPFNPATVISYQLPESGFVTLKVYDMLGKEVATLVNETKNAGYYNVNFDASKLTSGIYIYTIQANSPSAGSGHGFNLSKKMLLLR